MSTWKPKQRPALGYRALELIAIYDATYGASAPGACPDALANVLEAVGALSEAAMLRGERL